MSFDSAQNMMDFPFQLIVNEPNECILIAYENKAIFVNALMKKHLGLPANALFPVELHEIFSVNEFGDLYQKVSTSKNNDGNIQLIKYTHKSAIYEASLFVQKINGFEYTIFKSIQKSENGFYQDGREINVNDIFPFLIVDTDCQGNLLSVNQKFCDFLKFDSKDVTNGLNIRDIVSQGNQSILESLLRNYVEFASIESIELKLKKKSGGHLPVNMYFKAIVENNNYKGLHCMFIDISENKRIEHKYRHNQQRLRKILDLVPHMIFLKDYNGKILLSNKACADFYNTSAKDLVYENIAEFHHNKEELQRILNEDREVINSQTKKEWDNLVLFDANNQKHIYKTTKVPYQDNGSDEIYSLGISVDITSQRQAEMEKEEANTKYRLLVERGSDGILIVQENKIIFVNAQASKMIDKSVDELVGSQIGMIIPRNQLNKILEEYKKNTLNRNTNHSYSLNLSKPNGDLMYLEARISTINYEGKKSRLVFVRDVTKRSLAELQNDRNRNLLEQAQKIASLGSWEWDIVNKKLYCSDEIFKILEVNKDETWENSLSWLANFIAPHEKSKIYKGFLASINTGLKYEIDFPVNAMNGERKIVHSQSMVFNDVSGKPLSLMGTWIDISDRIRFEKMLKEAKSRAEESDKLKSAFLANMSHEIRTPMNAVLGFANLLKREHIDEKTRYEYIDHIVQSGEGLIKLINDIVDISKIESNQLKIDKGPVRINEVLEQIYNRYEELLLLKNNPGIKLVYEAAMPDPDFTIITDPYRLQQILSNLLNNAIKFTPQGEIKFGYNIVKSELLFFVQDDGIGIPDDKKEEIFKRFGKLEDPERMNKSGTGLGLSIAKSLLELLGGRIWLDKNEEKGARFCFSLPLEFGKKVHQNKKDNVKYTFSSEIDLHDKIILIAEDELLNFKLLETLLKKTNAKVLWAKNGIDAVQMVTDHKIDLVFMDIKMPDMNGYEATKHIKRIDPGIPIIAQTAFAFSNERNYILQSGCDMYMTKPIDHRELFKALKLFLT